MTTRRRRQQRPTPTAPALTPEQIRELGRELIGELAPLAGDADKVRETLLAWLDTEDTPRLSLIAMSAVQTMFADCLTRMPLDQIPAGALTLTPPERNTA